MVASAPVLTGMALSGPARSQEAPPIQVERSVRRVASDSVLIDDLIVAPGETIEIAAGATLSLRGDLIAPAAPIFSGEGAVDLTRSRVVAARPEWWGARPDDSGFDCRPALAACLRAHIAMQLGPGDYYLRDTLVVDRPNRRIWGVGRTKGAHGTRLVAHGKGHAVLVGTERAPASINDYLRGIDMRWIEIGRATAAPPPTGDDAEAAAGLAVRNVLDCNFEGLRSNEHAIGYSLRGAVRSYLRDCVAFRSIAADERDIFIGFDMDGRAPAIPTGGNASLYLIDCNASTGGFPKLRLSVGCRMTGAMSDSFLIRFETTSLANGIVLDGRAASLSPASRRGGHVDININSPVLDGCLESGIVIDGLSDGALVDIASPYIALANRGGTALAIRRSGGAIGIIGGQFIGWVAGNAGRESIGLAIEDTAGVACAGLKLAGFSRPVEASRVAGADLVLTILGGARPSPHPAIRMRGCRESYLRPRIGGSAPAYAAGVALDGSTGAIAVETVGIRPAAVRGAAVTIDGAASAAGGREVRVPGSLQS